MVMAIDNLGVYDPNAKYTEQGVSFQNYSKIYENAPGNKHDLLQISSSPDWSSVVEALDGDDSDQRQQQFLKDEISTLEIAFNKKIKEYTDLSYIYNSLVIRKQNLSTADLAILNKTRIDLKEKYEDILEITEKINKDINDLHIDDPSLNDNVSNQQKKLHKYMYQLAKIKERMNESEVLDMDSLNGVIETSTLNVVSTKYHYIVWFIMLLTILGFTINIIINPEANTMQAVIVVGLLVTVYYIAKWFGS